MTREEAIKFAEYAQIMAMDKPDVQEFYKLAEAALRQQNQKNAPLTLEELRQMDGEPVWVVTQNGGKWVIASGAYWWDSARNKEYGKTWLAYRRKPEEASK